MLPYLVWTLTVCLTAIGLLGIVLPVLPGTTLILAAMLLHKLLLPGDLSWAMLAWIALVWFVSVLVDFGGVLIGTRLCGGGKWGMAGATGGALVGMFFSLPMLVLGTVLGAMAAEKFIARKSHRASLLAGAGAALGFVISTVGRAFCAALMILLFVWGVYAARESSAPEAAATPSDRTLLPIIKLAPAASFSASMSPPDLLR